MVLEGVAGPEAVSRLIEAVRFCLRLPQQHLQPRQGARGAVSVDYTTPYAVVYECGGGA